MLFSQQTIPNAQNGANYFRFPLFNMANCRGQAKNAEVPTNHPHVHGHGFGYGHRLLLQVFPSLSLAFDSKTSLPYPCCIDVFFSQHPRDNSQLLY